MYYILGQMIETVDGFYYLSTTGPFFKNSVAWCKEHFGEPGDDWSYLTTESFSYDGRSFQIPCVISITDAEAATVYKLNFPTAHMEFSKTGLPGFKHERSD